MMHRLRYGLLHPAEAVSWFLWPRAYRRRLKVEKRAKEAEELERRIQPGNPLEEGMVKGTDIHEHLSTLYMLAVEFELKTILELGVRGGESTVALLWAAKEIGGRVYSMDVDPCLEAKAAVQARGLEDHWTFVLGNDLEVEWNRPIDYLFIDTTHTYDQTIKELAKYEPYVRPGGIITAHDIVVCPAVLRAITDYIRSKPGFRLYKYFNNYGLAVVFKSQTNRVHPGFSLSYSSRCCYAG